MAQNFRRYTLNTVGTVAQDIPDGSNFDTYDAIVGIMLSNVHTSAINVSCYINDGTNDIYLVKDAPIPAGGALDVLGTSKVVLETTDAIKIDCSVADKISGTISIMEIT